MIAAVRLHRMIGAASLLLLGVVLAGCTGFDCPCRDAPTAVAPAVADCTVARPDSPLTPEQAQAAFNCIAPSLYAGYGASRHVAARLFADWPVVSGPFRSAELGGRHVVVHAHPRMLAGPDDTVPARDRGLPIGGMLAAASFTVEGDGAVRPGPLTLIEKMNRGFTGAAGNWRYTEIAPDGAVVAVTEGGNADALAVCPGCAHDEADRLAAALMRGGVGEEATATE